MLLVFLLIPLALCPLIVWVEGDASFQLHQTSTNVIFGDSKETQEIFHRKMYSYLKNTKLYGNLSYEEQLHHIKEVEDWVAPTELQEKFPYFLSGYDFDDLPVWVMEWGKFNLREQTERGPEVAKNVTLYMFQAIHRVIKSMIVKDTPEKEIRRLVLIGDAEGLDFLQVAHVPMNYVATTAFNLVRPMLGGVFERFELYGTKKDTWMSALRKRLPLEVIPTWYGGSKDYIPIQVYG